MGQTTHDGEYSGNGSGLSRVNKTDNESYKDDARDDAYRDYMPAISGHLGDTVTAVSLQGTASVALHSASGCKKRRDCHQLTPSRMYSEVRTSLCLLMMVITA